MVHQQRALIRRLAAAGAVTCGVAFALGAGRQIEVRAASLAAASVSGPIKATAAAGDPSRDYPYSATVDDLTKYKYIEEEVFVAGTASRYTTPPLATGAVVDAGHPYKTRIIVRRPASAAAFNGTAVIEWNNV